MLNDNNITEEWKVMFNTGAGGVFINIYLKFLWFNFKESNRFCSPRALFSYFYPILLIIAATVASEEIRVDMIAGTFSFTSRIHLIVHWMLLFQGRNDFLYTRNLHRKIASSKVFAFEPCPLMQLCPFELVKNKDQSFGSCLSQPILHSEELHPC